MPMRPPRLSSPTPKRVRIGPRFYDTSLWRYKIAPQWLAEHPTCGDPFGVHGAVIVPATQVDHVTPISQGGDRTSGANLMSLCASCHSRKTRAESAVK